MNPIAIRYARAFFNVGLELNKLEAFSSDLANIINVLRAEPIIEEALFSDTKKEQLKLLEYFVNAISIDKYTHNFLNLLITKKRVSYLYEIYNALINLTSEKNNIERIELYSAKELQDENKKLLKEKFENLIKKTCEIEFKIDATLISGIRAKWKSYLIDSSIKTSLENMKKIGVIK
jgi:F-type H+-transporting ATPase subunit delta